MSTKKLGGFIVREIEFLLLCALEMGNPFLSLFLLVNVIAKDFQWESRIGRVAVVKVSWENVLVVAEADVHDQVSLHLRALPQGVAAMVGCLFRVNCTIRFESCKLLSTGVAVCFRACTGSLQAALEETSPIKLRVFGPGGKSSLEVHGAPIQRNRSIQQILRKVVLGRAVPVIIFLLLLLGNCSHVMVEPKQGEETGNRTTSRQQQPSHL